MSAEKNQRRAGVLLGYVNIVVKNVVNLLYTPMLLSFVGRGDYGVFQTVNSFVFSLTLLSFGFSGAYVRFYTRRASEGDEGGIRSLNGMYLLLYFAISLVAMAVGLLCSANVGVVFGQSFTRREVDLAASLTAVMSLNVAATLLSTVFDANVMVHEEFMFQQTRQLFTTLATPAFALALLFAGMGPMGVAVAQLAVSVTLLALNARFAVLRLGMRFDLRRVDWGLFREIAAFSAWLFANQVCELVNQNVPNVVLGAARGASDVSVFAVALQVRAVFYSISTTMSGVFVPLVNRMVAELDDDDGLTHLMARVGKYQAILYLWVYGGFAVLGRWFVTTWAGPAFSEAYPLLLAMAGPLFIPLTQNVGIEIQKAKNRHRVRSIAYLVFALVNLALTWALAPALGCWAPVIGYDVYVLLGCGLFMNWYYVSGIGLDMGLFWRGLLPVLVVASAAVAACLLGTYMLPATSLAGFLGWGALYTALFAALCWHFVLSEAERRTVTERLLGMLAGSTVRGGRE